MRRLAKDHVNLRACIPPNYLFAEDDEELPDDLTQLNILITGAHGTPYSQGLWKLQLKIPDEYPQSPPKANFKTRIFHPNVDENTGAVCLETLKRDWESKLTLKDILVTISCLLINPNPDSALNAEAGSLLQEDYETFARKAKLMTSIHAPIPKTLKNAVAEAKRRGEDEDVSSQSESEERPVVSRSISNNTSVTMKDKRGDKSGVKTLLQPLTLDQPSFEGEEQLDNTKENDPLDLPSAPSKIPQNPRKILGKRTISDVPSIADAEHLVEGVDLLDAQIELKTSSAQLSSEPLRKSPKLISSNDEGKVVMASKLDVNSRSGEGPSPRQTINGDDKENFSTAPSASSIHVQKFSSAPKSSDASTRPTLRKVSNVGSSRGKITPRVGIRRL